MGCAHRTPDILLSSLQEVATRTAELLVRKIGMDSRYVPSIALSPIWDSKLQHLATSSKHATAWGAKQLLPAPFFTCARSLPLCHCCLPLLAAQHTQDPLLLQYEPATGGPWTKSCPSTKEFGGVSGICWQWNLAGWSEAGIKLVGGKANLVILKAGLSLFNSCYLEVSVFNFVSHIRLTENNRNT